MTHDPYLDPAMRLNTPEGQRRMARRFSVGDRVAEDPTCLALEGWRDQPAIKGTVVAVQDLISWAGYPTQHIRVRWDAEPHLLGVLDSADGPIYSIADLTLAA